MKPDEGSFNAIVPLKVINTRGPEIPTTGDNGLWQYGIYGALFIAAACLVLYLALRKRKIEVKK